ncbi:MAG: c-type cytochrome [Lentisphaerales bacterium]|nr:c-type cytochrome [Lentisphaerales bacterium]
MKTKWISALISATLLLTNTSFGAVDFTKDLMPVLENKCLKCHGRVKENGKVVDKGDLDITKPESIKEFLKVGHPQDSLMYTLVISDDDEEYMPPKGDRLSDAEKKLISDWIKEGASFAGYTRKVKKDSSEGKGTKETKEKTVITASKKTFHKTLDFTKDVFPILEKNCLKCHGHIKESGKVVDKGDLDITKPESIKEFLMIGHPQDSLMYQLVISDDDDEYMPPKGDRLSVTEKKIISDWIEQGASFSGYTKKVKEESLLQKMAKSVGAPNAKTITHFKGLEAIVLPLTRQSPLLQIDFKLIAKKTTPALTKRLIELKDNVVNLNLSKFQIDDSSLKTVGQLKNLIYLYLDNTAVTDKGLTSLQSLSNLEYLNLYNTAVTDKGLQKLTSLKKLKKLYLWQTKVSEAGVAKIQQALPGIHIHYKMPMMPKEYVKRRAAALIAEKEAAKKKAGAD